MSATSTALLLNADYRPIKVIPWVRAVHLLLEEKADLVQEYLGRVLHSPSRAMPWPAVVRLRRFVRSDGRVRFSRQNVLARDGYRCGYCGAAPRAGHRPDIEALTIDHVVPRAQARGGMVTLPWSRRVVPVTCWENVTTACEPCNMRKASRTPDQAGMRLVRTPRAPTPADVLRMTLVRVHIPDEWKAYLPNDSEWRDYWEAELE